MKILFIPMDGHGHVNSCIGLALSLRDFGHQSVFAVPQNWSSCISKYNLEVEIANGLGVDPTVDPVKQWAAFVRGNSEIAAKPPLEQVRDNLASIQKLFVDHVKRTNDSFEAVIGKVKPDLIVIDFYVTVPAVVNSGIPWMILYSANPLVIYDSPTSPPKGSGLGINDDPEKIKEFRDLYIRESSKAKADLDIFLRSKGIEPHPTKLISPSPYLNVYSYPQGLDYSELGPAPDNWFRLDHMVRTPESGSLGIDESFLETEEKKIFFSLGSMGSADVILMNKLLAMLKDSKHRFIVSKGFYHEEIQLYDNMIGTKHINQIKLLDKVDLVITHGGNNTVIEAVLFDKPCIVLPLSGDQHDNGRRVTDKRIGKWFAPYRVTKEEFIQGIEEILNDQELLDRVKVIGEQTRNSKSHQQLNERLLKLVSQSSGPSSNAHRSNGHPSDGHPLIIELDKGLTKGLEIDRPIYHGS